jgi:aminoglycoside phosphotransferase (APT) family kinase protein
MAASGWAAIVEEGKVGTSKVAWDEHLVRCLDVSFAKANWEDRPSGGPFSLVHGDAHAHNALWCPNETRLRLIDFEMVGVGSPGQELGQYVISHMTPAVRRECESSLVDVYHTTLTEELRKLGKEAEADVYTRDVCWNEYVAGGAGRWAWFIPLFRANAPMCQYFADQLSAFLKDHVKNPEDMPMPRV